MAAEIPSPKTEPRVRRSDAVVTGAGAVCGGIGLLVLAGWHLHIPALLQVRSGLTPVQYNTALSFAFCGAALIALALGRRRVTLGCAALVGLVAALTGLEYFFTIDLKIDRLLFDPYLITVPVHPGRMAPNTVVALLAGSMSLVLIAWRLRGRFRLWIAATASSLALAIALVSAAGYVASLGAAYRWGQERPIAVLAVLALSALGAGLLRAAFLENKRESPGWPEWISAAVAVGFGSATLLLWHALQVERYANATAGEPGWWAPQAALLLALLATAGIAYSVHLTRTARHAEQQLRRASLYARSLLEASLDPLVTISKDGKIMDVNQATEAVTGFPRGSLIGSDFSDYFTDPEKARAGYEQVFAQGFVRDYPLAIRHYSGRITQVVYNAAVFTDEAGRIEGVFAAARDITERREAESALQHSEARYRSLAVATAQVVWTTNPGGEVEDMPMWRELTGQSVEQVRGRGWLDALHPDDRERTAEVWRRAVETRANYEIEYRVRRCGGTYGDFWARGVPVLEPDGSTIREWVGTCTDITERKRGERALEQYAAELKRSNAELQDFAYIASHDLQEPLRKITAFGDRLSEHCLGGLDETGRDYLARMLNASTRMAALINGLLEYSRVSSRAEPLATVDLMHVAFEVLVDLEERIHACQGRVEIELLPKVYADRLQMRQLLQNLVANALKFRRPGVAPEVKVGWRHADESWLEIFVADQGIGFDESYVSRLFRPFQRLHGRSEYEGSGMGLAICRKIAERHGGSIHARSAPGEGSTFVVRLPATMERREECNADQNRSTSCSPKTMTTITC